MNAEDRPTSFSYYAFFDVDGTIINIKSMFSFLRYHYQQTSTLAKLFSTIRYALACFKCGIWSKSNKPREIVNSNYYHLYKDKKYDQIMLQGQKWFNKINKNKSNLFNKKILHEIKKHKDAGAGIVLVSGSFPPCLDPLAKYIGADYLLASKLETKQGVITGNLLPPQCIGRGKMTAIELFMSSQKSDNYQDCFAYGDHISDLAMLEKVGNPVVVLNDPILATHASNKGWKIISNTSEDNNSE